jgi:hypothetical protein
MSMATAIPLSFDARTDHEGAGVLPAIPTLEELQAEAAHLEAQGLGGQALRDALFGPSDLALVIRSPEELDAWVANGCEP